MNPAAQQQQQRGLILGALAIFGFSLTLPMTRLAVADLNPLFAGLGRSLISAVIAALMLIKHSDSFPPRRLWGSLFVVGLGCVVGFPLFLSAALQHVPASHGAVVTGVLPLLTAFGAVLRTGEKPSREFWIAAIAGSAAVVAFVLVEGGWNLSLADGWLLIAVVSCAVGYVEGGRLAREIGGMRVIAWALIFMTPALIAVVGYTVWKHGVHASPLAWAAFGYTGAISMFFGMWAWYAALALGGVARVGQLQLVQPFLSIGWAALLLGEHITLRCTLTAAFVVAAVAFGQRTAIRRLAPA